MSAKMMVYRVSVDFRWQGETTVAFAYDLDNARIAWKAIATANMGREVRLEKTDCDAPLGTPWDMVCRQVPASIPGAVTTYYAE